jgi:hypothetical protein
LKNLAFYDFSGLDAARANADALAAAVDLGLDGLKVDVPPATVGVVGVRDVVAELRAFAAEITFLCHDLLLILSRRNFPGLSVNKLQFDAGKEIGGRRFKAPGLYRLTVAC